MPRRANIEDRDRRHPALAFLIVVLLVTACSGNSDSGTRYAYPNTVATSQVLDGARLNQPSASPSEPTPTTARELRSIQPTRVVIPSLDIDIPVGIAQVYRFVPTSKGPAGCPPYKHEYDSGVRTPDRGVATPDENLPELANKTYVFGHSRWLGTNGILFKLQDVNLGDEVIIDGVDRDTSEHYSNLRFRVTRIYLGDVDSGSEILNAWTPEQVPIRPIVLLQTSVRENGIGKQWILDQDKVLGKAENTVEGDLNDTCKYLTLYVAGDLMR